ncbi:MAG: hypothetical protein OXT65_06745 [Alphaproteobacteria bacterium]|nr:hypothetical protein [Alphaproteobacteria bacterium]
MSRKSRNRDELSYLLMGFAVLCFIAAFYFNGETGKDVHNLPPAGGIVGPVVAAKKNTVYDIRVRYNRLTVGSWANVEGSVLDENKNYLFGFGKELYYETGHDSDGKWTEHVKKYDLPVTFPEKGTYYIRMAVESGRGFGAGSVETAATPSNAMTITVARQRGSSLPHMLAGILAFVIGCVRDWFRKTRG